MPLSGALLRFEAFLKKFVQQRMIKFARALDRSAGARQRRVHGVEDASDSGLLAKVRRHDAPDCADVTLAYLVECRSSSEALDYWRQQVEQVVEVSTIDSTGEKARESLVGCDRNCCNGLRSDRGPARVKNGTGRQERRSGRGKTSFRNALSRLGH